MSMQALDFGLDQVSLVSNLGGNSFRYLLKQVPKQNLPKVRDLRVVEVADTDDCRIYRKGHLVAITSTQELSKLQRLGNFNTFEVVNVKAHRQVFNSAVDEDVLKREYVGILTDVNCKVSALVMKIKDSFWAHTGSRLIYLDYKTDRPLVKLNGQDSLRFASKNPHLFKYASDEIILFR